LNRLVRGILAGGLLGLAAAGAMTMVNRRQRLRMMRMRNMSGTRRTLKMVRNNAFRIGSALKSGTEAFASRLAETGSWGRT